MSIGDLKYVRGKLKHIRVEPKHVRGEPKHIRVEPKHIRGKPKHIRGELKHVRGERKHVRGVLKHIRGVLKHISQQSVIKNLECHNNYDDIDNDNNDCKVCSSNNLELCNYKVEISHNVDVFDLVLYITPEKNSSFYHHQTKSYDFEVTSEKKNILTSTIFLIIHPQIFVTC